MKLDDNFCRQALEAMRQAVNEALLKKQKLGQYAVRYNDNKIQIVTAQCLPVTKDNGSD